MSKNVLTTGLFGGVIGFLWLIFSNAMIPFKSEIIHNTVPNQMELHSALKANITEPGTYSVPYLPNDRQDSFPDYREQPVYSITYSGHTHGDPGSIVDIVAPIVLIFAAALLVSWMLSVTSQELTTGYGKRFFFVTLVGVVIALYDDLMQMFLGPQPRDYLAYLAINNVLAWVLMGLVIAWKIKPKTG